MACKEVEVGKVRSSKVKVNQIRLNRNYGTVGNLKSIHSFLDNIEEKIKGLGFQTQQVHDQLFVSVKLVPTENADENCWV